MLGESGRALVLGRAAAAAAAAALHKRQRFHGLETAIHRYSVFCCNFTVT